MRGLAVFLICFGSTLLAAPSHAGFEAPGPGPVTSKDLFDPKNWEITIRTFFGYNDNANTVSKGDPFFTGDTDSTYAGTSINGVITYAVDDTTDVGAALRFDQTVYLSGGNSGGDNFSDYNMTAVSPSVFAEKRFVVASRPAKVGASYSFRYDRADIEAVGIKAHTVNLNGAINIDPTLQAALDYSVSWNDFSVSFPAPVNDRDSLHTSINLSGTKWFDGRSRSITLALGYANNNADGKNFDYHGYKVGLTGKSRIAGPVWGSVDVSYDMRDYRGFTPPPTRKRQDIFSAGAQLIWAVDPSWTVDAYYNYSDIDSNNTAFEGSTNDFGLGVTFKF